MVPLGKGQLQGGFHLQVSTNGVVHRVPQPLYHFASRDETESARLVLPAVRRDATCGLTLIRTRDGLVRGTDTAQATSRRPG